MTIKVGIIGCGKYMVKWSEDVSLIDCLYNNENVEITAICDPVLERLEFAKIVMKDLCEKKKKTYNEPINYRDFRDILEDTNVDAILISSTHWWNAEMAYQSCLNKKYVFCEKPLGINIIDGRKLLNIVKKNNIIFQSGFQFKNSALPTQVKTFIKNKMNRIKEIEIQGGNCGTYYSQNNQKIPISDITKKNLITNNDFNLVLGHASNYISSLADKNNGKQIKYHSDFISKITDNNLPLGIDENDDLNIKGWRSYFNYGNGSITSIGSHLFEVMIFIMEFDNNNIGPYKIEPSNSEYGTKIYYKKDNNDIILKHTEGNFVFKFIDIDNNWLTYRITSFDVESNLTLDFEISSETNLRQLNIDNWINNITNSSNTNSVYYAERGHYASILSYLFNLAHNLPVKKTLYFDFKNEKFTLDETNAELDTSTNLFLYDNSRDFHKINSNIINPINFGAQGDGITDDSDIINSLITEDIIIDLGNKTYKCNKTIDIKHDNVIIQNGILDFTDIEKNEPFYMENTTQWTTACGIRILGSQESPVQFTYGINHQTNHYNDFVRIDKSDNNFNNDDFVFIDSDLIHSDTGGGGTGNGLKNGEIIQIDRVHENQWEKYSFDENDRTLKGEKPPNKNDNDTQLNFVNSTNEDYLVKDNAKIAKLNLRKNIILNNLTLKSKQLTTEELNNPDRFRAHRTEWRNEKNLVGNEYLGTAIWVQCGYNINVENCKIYNWYDTGIVVARSIQCNINNLECNHIYANGKGYGINIRDGSQKINITNSSFTDQRHPISIGGLDGISRNIKITNNSINKSRDAGIDSHSAGQFLIIDNNHIVCEGSDGEHDGIIIEGLDSIITNNIIEGIIRNGIYIQPTFNYFKEPSYKIDNNIINAKPDYTYSSGIRLSNVTSKINNLSIVNNTINNELPYGIYIKDNYKITSSKISNNDINLCNKGIYLYKMSNVNIIANNINNQEQNIYIRFCKNINVNNNIFNTKHECLYIRDSNFINLCNNSIDYNVDAIGYKMLNLYKVNKCNIISNIINGISTNYQSYKTNIYFLRCNNIILQSNNIYTDDDIEKWITNIFLSSFNNHFLIANNVIKSNLKYRHGIYIKENDNSTIKVSENIL